MYGGIVKSEDSYYSVPLEKGLRILKLFTHDQDLSLQEVSRKAGISKTSAFRFCSTLVKLGYLRKSARTKLLELGTNAFMLGNGLMRGFDLYQIVKPFLDEACNTHSVTVDSCVFDGESLGVLYRREVTGGLTYRLPMMTDALTCTALGKAILAFLSEEERQRLVEKLPKERRTANTLVSVEEIMSDLHITGERGYALNNEEFFPGFIAIAAPLMNLNTRTVVGAVCFDFSTQNQTVAGIEGEYGQAIKKLGADISRAVPD
jgi:DNA-binding IclR family transcriptional regulator